MLQLHKLHLYLSHISYQSLLESVRINLLILGVDPDMMSNKVQQVYSTLILWITSTTQGIASRGVAQVHWEQRKSAADSQNIRHAHGSCAGNGYSECHNEEVQQRRENGYSALSKFVTSKRDIKTSKYEGKTQLGESQVHLI